MPSYVAEPPEARLLQPPRFSLSPNRRTEAAARRRQLRDLNQAVRNEELTLQFQPRVRLAYGALAGVDAVVIWPQRRARPIMARRIEPHEHNATLGGWALITACNQAAQQPPPNPVWRMSVSIGAEQLSEGVLLSQLADALHQSALPAERLELAFAETILQDASLDTLLTLSAIRDLGISLSLDAFGTGLASLAQLKRLPLTCLKLDSSLIQNVPEHREDSAILRAIIQAGRALGLEIVACGVDAEAQRGFLVATDCDCGQGSLFGLAGALPVAQR